MSWFSFILGLLFGGLVTFFAFCLILSSKHRESCYEKNVEKKLFDYCQKCYEPINDGELYVKAHDKNYCLKCGSEIFKENNIKIAGK